MSKHKHRCEHREVRREQFVARPACVSRGVSWNAVIVGAGLVLLLGGWEDAKSHEALLVVADRGWSSGGERSG